jgi:HAD superfamily hydrolase (TIGR01509 family)
METRIKGVVFDMDGTLVDNMYVHERAWREFLHRYGIVMSEQDFHRNNVGTIRQVVANFFPHIKDEEELMRLGLEKEAHYQDIYRGGVAPIPGLDDFLRGLQEAGIPMALASAAHQGNIDFTLDALGIRDFFTAVTGSDEVPAGKPDPTVYRRSAEKLGVPPASCMAFEDSFSGIRSALAADMKVVAMATTHTKEELSGFPLHGILTDYIMPDPVGFINRQA